MQRTRVFAQALRLPLIAAPLLLAAGCSQAPAPGVAELQQRVTAAEARADLAEKRAKNAEAVAAQHLQEPQQQEPPAAPPEIAQVDGGSEMGQPAMDTAPIDPVPAMPTEPQHP
jgi:Tfp pilus assembly protein PilP